MNSTVKNCDHSTLLSPFPRSEVIAWCVAFAAVGLAVVVLNLATIAIFATNKRLRERKFYLLLNLAVADLLVGIIAIPYFVYSLGGYWGLWQSTSGLKNFMSVSHAGVFSGFSSIINLAMIAVERFYATFWPFRYHVLQNKVYVVSIALIWIIAALLSTVLSITRGLLTKKEKAYIWVPFAIALFLIVCVSYASILAKVRGGERRLQGVTERNRKLTKSVLILTLVSFLTWMPYAILNAIMSLDSYYTCNVKFYYALLLVHYFKSLVNPIFYVMRIPNVCIKKAILPIRPAIQLRSPPPNQT